MKYIKLFEDFDPYSVDELISMNPNQLGKLLLKEKVLEQPKLVKNILDIGARIDIQNDSTNTTPLHLATLKCLVDVVKLLIEAGAPLWSEDVDGWTPLHYAALTGHVEITEMLINAGSQLDARNSNNSTPLHLAASFDRIASAKALIDAGASLDVQNIYGITPWGRAKEKTREALPELNPEQ